MTGRRGKETARATGGERGRGKMSSSPCPTPFRSKTAECEGL